MGKNKIHYTAESRRDLDEIWDYIGSDLQNVSAAERIVNRIMDDVDHLENHAEMGAPLSSIADIESAVLPVRRIVIICGVLKGSETDVDIMIGKSDL